MPTDRDAVARRIADLSATYGIPESALRDLYADGYEAGKLAWEEAMIALAERSERERRAREAAARFDPVLARIGGGQGA